MYTLHITAAAIAALGGGIGWLLAIVCLWFVPLTRAGRVAGTVLFVVVALQTFLQPRPTRASVGAARMVALDVVTAVGGIAFVVFVGALLVHFARADRIRRRTMAAGTRRDKRMYR